jgi:hypothetical protein
LGGRIDLAETYVAPKVGSRTDDDEPLRLAATRFALLLYLYVAAFALLFGVWMDHRNRMGVDRPAQAAGVGAEAG